MNANILIQAHSHNRRPQIFFDVVGEGAQRRDVNTADAGWQLAAFDLTKQGIENTKKAGQGFSATGRRRKQDGLAIENCGDAEQLGVREIGIARAKPLAQPRMQFRGKGFGCFW